MRIAVVFNPKAGSAGLMDALRDHLATSGAVTLLESADGDDLKRKVRDAVGRFDRVAVAGGDGTVHAAVNALAPDFPPATLAVIPLGTGNDLCRTLGVPLDPPAAADLAAGGPARPIDVVRVTGEGGTLYSVNAVTGGFSGHVASEVTSELKQAWGPLAYLRGAVGAIADPPVYRLTLRFDGGPPERFDALNVVVANARTAAGGVVVAPTANPEDGRFDVVLVRAGGLADLSIVAARLMEGDYLADDNVLHRRAARLELESDPPLPISVDGERTEGRRWAFAAVPRAVRLVVGPDYVPSPARPPAEVAHDDAAPDPAPPRGVRQRLFGLLAAGMHLLRESPGVYGGGLAVTLLGVFGFAWLANGVTAGHWKAANEAVTNALHASATPELDRIAVAVTSVGDPWETTAVSALVAAWFLARRRYLNAATVIAIAVGAVAIEVALKLTFRLDRPALFESIRPAAGYTFPSGHALRGTATYAGLAVLLLLAAPRAAWRWAVAVLAVALSAAICWSRVYLGVHWLTDVIGGALAATFWVTVCLLARHYAQTHPRKPRP
jgi:diacylglycerol kinase (ATP)